MNNLIFFNEKYINTVIFKNCQSTLGAIYLYKYFNYDYNEGNENDKTWNLLNSKFCKNEQFIENLQKNQNFKKFVVWCDPFDRFLSLYKDMLLDDNNHIFLQLLGLNNKLKPKDFLNVYLNLLEYEEHHKPQYKFYKNVDFIVPINKLDKFIYNELKFEYNIHKNSTEKLDSSLYEEMFKYKDIIYDNYKEDLDLIKKYKIYE